MKKLSLLFSNVLVLCFLACAFFSPLLAQTDQPAPIPAEGAAPPTSIPAPTQPPTTDQSLQTPAQPPVPGQPTPRRPTAGTRPQAGGAGASQISLNFDDADVFSVVQMVFGEILKYNYIIDPRVKGRVTFRSVAPIPRDNILQIMEVILRLNGVAMVEEGGLYRIIPIGDVSKEPVQVSMGRDPEKIEVKGKALLQVVPVYYISSSEIIKVITPFLSANAVVVDIPKSNQIVIVDTDANVRRLVQMVSMFDTEKLKEKNPQVFVYAVQNGKSKDVATLLQQIFLGSRQTAATPTSTPDRPSTTMGTSPSSPPSPVPPPSTAPRITSAAPGAEVLVSPLTRIFADEVANTVIILATPEDYVLIRDTINQVDVVPRQVVIEGIIAEITLVDKLSFGLAWSLKANLSFAGPFDRTNLKGQIALNPSRLAVDPTKLSGNDFTFVATDDAGVVRAVINTLATESKAKLLAAPHILVSDNKEARIQVGQQVPVVTSEILATTTVPAQQTIQYKDIGIILKVKPRVNEGGLVSLELNQEVSTFSTITLGVNSTQIILNKTEAGTSLVVQDGQSIIIGGLIREDSNRNRSGIPFLSKIPLLGALFGSTDRDTTRTEIVMLLTPHVIKNQKDAQDVTSDYVDRYTSVSKGGVKKEDLLKERLEERKAPARPAGN